MGFTILNTLDTATIKALNARFNKNYRKSIPLKTITELSNHKDVEFNRMKKFIESNQEVHYDKNTY